MAALWRQGCYTHVGTVSSAIEIIPGGLYRTRLFLLLHLPFNNEAHVLFLVQYVTLLKGVHYIFRRFYLVLSCLGCCLCKMSLSLDQSLALEAFCCRGRTSPGRRGICQTMEGGGGRLPRLAASKDSEHIQQYMPTIIVCRVSFSMSRRSSRRLLRLALSTMYISCAFLTQTTSTSRLIFSALVLLFRPLFLFLETL